MMSLEMFHEQILKGKNPQEVYELIEDFKIEMIFANFKSKLATSYNKLY